MLHVFLPKEGCITARSVKATRHLKVQSPSPYTILPATRLFLVCSDNFQMRQAEKKSWNTEAVPSHLLGLLGFLLRIPGVSVVHAALPLRGRSQQAVYERGRRRL